MILFSPSNCLKCVRLRDFMAGNWMATFCCINTLYHTHTHTHTHTQWSLLDDLINYEYWIESLQMLYRCGCVLESPVGATYNPTGLHVIYSFNSIDTSTSSFLFFLANFCLHWLKFISKLFFLFLWIKIYSPSLFLWFPNGSWPMAALLFPGITAADQFFFGSSFLNAIK